jgi:hypothetical protein
MPPRQGEWLLFDDQGATWTARSLELKRRLSRFHGDGELAAQFVCNLGFVAGRRLSENAAVRLRLQVVSEIALAAAFYWLADHDPRRVLIDFAGESRPAEVCTSAAAAIARLIELTQEHDLRRDVAEKHGPLDRPASTIVAAR